jgi:hypothetical protein
VPLFLPTARRCPRNTVAVDYFCPACKSPFQLKSQSKPLGSRIVDAAYSEMKRAIIEDRTPNFCVLHYDLDTWAVRTVLLVPPFAFALAAVERRKPLAATARRAGWVGCNILLDKIPVNARISVVNEGTPQTSQQVRASYISGFLFFCGRKNTRPLFPPIAFILTGSFRMRCCPRHTFRLVPVTSS